MTGLIPSKHFYGMAERNANFRIDNGIHTVCTRDRPFALDDGKLPGKNTYGHHPMYLNREQSANYHIVFLRNSNCFDFELKTPLLLR